MVAILYASHCWQVNCGSLDFIVEINLLLKFGEMTLMLVSLAVLNFILKCPPGFLWLWDA